MRSCDEPGKTSVEPGDRRLAMGAIRWCPPQTNGSARSYPGIRQRFVSDYTLICVVYPEG
jgi:hypothetical protein